MSTGLMSAYGDQILREFCEEIVRCMVVYGGWDEQRARQRLEESGHCSPEANETDGDRGLLFHEYPYYWAMGLIYAREDPQWFNNEELGLWPPPEEATQFWVTHDYPKQERDSSG